MRHSGRAGALGGRLRRCAAAMLLALSTVGAAFAADAPRALSMEGATLRLVAEPPESDGTVRAALLVDLEPGWKTYWLDPGDAGIPPRLDLSASTNLVALRTAFPLPHRTSDAYGASNVYSQPLAVALTLRRPRADEPATIALRLTLGLCREVCIPVDVRLGLSLAETGAADARLVAYAFDALPDRSGEEAGIRSARLSKDGRTIEVEVLAPDERPTSGADLFLAGPAGWFFGAPSAPLRDGRRLRFAVPVTARPRSAGTAPPAAVEAVATLGARAFRADDLPVGTAP